MAKSRVEEWIAEEGLDKISAWARNGLTRADIAKNIGVARSTFSVWVKENPELQEVLKTSSEQADAVIENALYKNAKGFFYDEETVCTVRRVEYENGKRVSEITEPRVVTIKHYQPPETKAAFIWLKNRKPDTWRDKHEIDDPGGQRIAIIGDAEGYAG